MIMNYFSLIDEIKQVSLRYSEEFYEGDIYEYLNSGNHKYPCIILTVQNITTDNDVNTISATIFAVDRLTNDSSNKLEVQSLCMSKITQILGTLEERVNNIQSNTLTPFTEKFSDLCGGMYGEFTLEYIGDNLCVDEIEIKEIELTQNGIYDVIGYDRAIVNVIPVVTLKDITITANGEYLPSDYDVDGFSKVTAEFDTSSLPKVKVTNVIVNNDCINEDGRWWGDTFIDTSLMGSLMRTFQNCTNLQYFYADDWNTDNITTMQQMFSGCTNLKEVRISNWNTQKVTNLTGVFNGCRLLKNVDVSKMDTRNVTIVAEMFFNCVGLQQLDLCNWDATNIRNYNYFLHGCSSLTNIIGGKTIDDVLQNNISCLNNFFGTSQVAWLAGTKLDRASLRALINGLLDLSDTDAGTLILGATLIAKLTEEDIAVAVNKNWSIV